MDTACRSHSPMLWLRSSAIFWLRSSAAGAMALLSCLMLLVMSSPSAFAGPATHFKLDYQVPGFTSDYWLTWPEVSVPLFVTALDADGNVDTTYSGTVHLTSTDAKAKVYLGANSTGPMPTDFTLTAGILEKDISLYTAGDQTFTATDTANPSITGTSGITTVSSSYPVRATISGAPSRVSPGQLFTVSVRVYDAYDNEVTGTDYPLDMFVDCSDPSAYTPFYINYEGDYDFAFNTLGGQSVHLNSINYGISLGFGSSVVGGAASFSVYTQGSSGPSVGKPIQMYLQAEDEIGQDTPFYNGTAHLTSGDPNAILPADVTFVNGVATPTVTFMTPGSHTFTVVDSGNSAITGQSDIFVSDPATSYSVSVPPNSPLHHSVTVTASAKEFLGNVVGDYNGTANITTSDPAATVPTQVTFTSGQATFDVTFNTTGNRTITLTAQSDSSVTGTGSTSVFLPATKYVMTAPSPITAGVYFMAHITALDSANKPIPNYTGTAHFISSDPKAVLPPDTVFKNGAADVRVTLKTSGRQTLTAVDTANGWGPATQFVVNVLANAPAHFKIDVPATATAGSAFNAVVSAIDSYGNTATSYTGTIHFSSSDPQAVLPGDFTITGGSRPFTFKLKTAGTQRISVTDTTATSITGTSSAIAVTAGTAARLILTMPSTSTAGSAFYGSVKAVDAYGNLAPSYGGTLHFTSTDAKAVLPADSTLTNGTRQFSFKLKTKGNQTIKATDTVKPSLTITTAPISVS